jgi:hypothetical protein
MQNNLPKENQFLTLIRQNAWNVEDFISLLKQAANRNKELVFFDNFADLLSECSALSAVFKLQDPRSIILSFIAQYKIFNKSENDFYHQTFEPVLAAMISSSPNCIHRISSANLIKRMVIKTILPRFDLESPFIRFVTDVRAAIKIRAPAQKIPRSQ